MKCEDNMKNLKIGDKITRFPLIQGGMGVGISLGRLAGSVAKEGGIGIISTAQIGYRDPEFDKNPAQANIRAIESDRWNYRLQHYDCSERICISCKGCRQGRS